MTELTPPVLEGHSGSSGQGYSELKDIECEWRYAHIQSYLKRGVPVPTNGDEMEAFRAGTYMHAGRAKWMVLGMKVDSDTVKQCQGWAKQDCIAQGYSMPELTTLEYELMLLNYVNYWAIRVMPKPYAVELFLEFDFYVPNTSENNGSHKRTTRLDDLSFYPDVGGHCIGEFKTTYDLSGALKFYNANNPQILLQQLIYQKCNGIDNTVEQVHPTIKGTMVDIWDKARNRGTRQYIPLDQSVLKKFEVFLRNKLYMRSMIIENPTLYVPQRNYFVCNTFNDAYKSQCKFKERCAESEN